MATDVNRQILNYFTHPSFFELDEKRGVIRTRGGTRLCMVNDDFLRGFVSAIERETGDATPAILRRCGTFFGKRLAHRFETELSELSGVAMEERAMYEFSALIQDMWRGCGMGDIRVRWEMGPRGFLPVTLESDPIVEINPGSRESDDLFAGILEGVMSHFAGNALTCVQTGDERRGSPDGTTFVLANAEVAKRVEPWIAEGVSHGEIVDRLAS